MCEMMGMLIISDYIFQFWFTFSSYTFNEGPIESMTILLKYRLIVSPSSLLPMLIEPDPSYPFPRVGRKHWKPCGRYVPASR
ncbi:hypothetical protein AALO_G00030040 [Alosa alosa]|uniref:Uncharacterized protein n=1 Tax=Alosa alosa TaxID=278164 RepID=A0AAV6HEV4_9TELE|nr:hypothetical protein AALO_G00030040 [Alosa alosa]